MAKSLAEAIEASGKWIIENKLFNQESMLESMNISKIATNIQQFILELNEIQELINSKQSEINLIRDLSDNINASLSKTKSGFSHLTELISTAENIKKRYRSIYVQITER